MRMVTCSMGVSLDGYIVRPDGGFGWSAPDEEVFRFATDEVRQVGVHLLGRRLYETMLYWETADQDPALTDLEREFAALWVSLPKVVFSKTLSAVAGSNRLATGNLAEEVERWRAEPGQGDIAIGGATLAAVAAELGLIDAYGLRVHPVLVGGGTPPSSPGRSAAQILNSSAATSSTVESCTSATACRTEPGATQRLPSPRCPGCVRPCWPTSRRPARSPSTALCRRASDSASYARRCAGPCSDYLLEIFSPFLVHRQFGTLYKAAAGDSVGCSSILLSTENGTIRL